MINHKGLYNYIPLNPKQGSYMTTSATSSRNPIVDCDFSLSSLGDAYQYTTQFLDAERKVVSTASSVFYRRQGPANPGNVVDIYSQNGRSLPNPTDLLGGGDGHLIEHGDLRGLRRVANKLQLNPEQDRTVFVLDLRDVGGSYVDPTSIEESEKVVCEYISSKKQPEGLGKSAKKAHELFHSKLPVDFVLCEGSLKHELLKGLDETQMDYFLNTGKTGRTAFCEYTEPFMTAMKLGDELKVFDLREGFLIPVSPPQTSPENFSPRSVSTVYYPEEYQDLYSPQARIPQALSKVLPVTFSVDPVNQITEMTILES